MTMDSPHRDESATLQRRIEQLRSENIRLEEAIRRRGPGDMPPMRPDKRALVALMILMPVPIAVAGTVAGILFAK
jgi:hypothetical protein